MKLNNLISALLASTLTAGLVSTASATPIAVDYISTSDLPQLNFGIRVSPGRVFNMDSSGTVNVGRLFSNSSIQFDSFATNAIRSDLSTNPYENGFAWFTQGGDLVLFFDHIQSGKVMVLDGSVLGDLGADKILSIGAEPSRSSDIGTIDLDGTNLESTVFADDGLGGYLIQTSCTELVPGAVNPSPNNFCEKQIQGFDRLFTGADQYDFFYTSENFDTGVAGLSGDAFEIYMKNQQTGSLSKLLDLSNLDASYRPYEGLTSVSIEYFNITPDSTSTEVPEPNTVMLGAAILVCGVPGANLACTTLAGSASSDMVKAYVDSQVNKKQHKTEIRLVNFY